MDHHHTYDHTCEHHEELCAKLDLFNMNVEYMLAILHSDMHALGSHVAAIEDEEQESNEEASSEEESEHESPEEESEEEPEAEAEAEGAEEVVIPDDEGLPPLPVTERSSETHRLPMIRPKGEQ